MPPRSAGIVPFLLLRLRPILLAHLGYRPNRLVFPVAPNLALIRPSTGHNQLPLSPWWPELPPSRSCSPVYLWQPHANSFSSCSHVLSWESLLFPLPFPEYARMPIFRRLLVVPLLPVPTRTLLPPLALPTLSASRPGRPFVPRVPASLPLSRSLFSSVLLPLKFF